MLLALLLTAALTSSAVEIRLACNPKPNVTEAECNSNLCTFDNAAGDTVPRCYFKQPLKYTHVANDTYEKAFNDTDFMFGMTFEKLKFETSELGKVLRIRILPEGKDRFEPNILTNTNHISADDDFNVFMSRKDFTFTVTRSSTGTTVFDTSIGGLVFADQYIQIATRLPSENLYGLGENVHQTLKHKFDKYKTWSMFARDQATESVGEHTGNLYGVHPFYLVVENDGKAHGVLFLNSNAQEVTTGPGPHLVYRTIGGLLDMYFFPGPKPEQVIQQYHALIGKPFMPPFWALGFQLSRYGYKSLDEVKEVVKNVTEKGIPLETIYADIDYMNRYMDFTLGDKWTGFGDYANELHQNYSMKLILIFDPAVDATSDAFKNALNKNASFVTYPDAALIQHEVNDNYTGSENIMLGVVWPDHHAAFPDFFDTNVTKEWWKDEFVKIHNSVSFDGIWIDMNEPAAFGTDTDHPWYFDNPDHPNIVPLKCKKSGKDELDKYEHPPYLTHAVFLREKEHKLNQKTLCLYGKTHQGTEFLYNSKNMYGLYETIATDYAARNAIPQRSVVISRSTFPSSGRYGGHWLGDNSATWDDLRTSIIGVQEFNMFGIPYVGSDICGFLTDTEEELCLRWQQAGAFHPFSRNHNDAAAMPQDPAQWESVSTAARTANLFRYSFLSYLYSLHFYVALHGGTVVRPLFFEFPDDAEARERGEEFLWGDSMLIAPVYTKNVKEVEVYFPDTTWFSLRESTFGLKTVGPTTNVESALITELIPVYLRAGKIIPRQEPTVHTKTTRSNPLTLLIGALEKLDGNNITLWSASGEMYYDVGDDKIDNISDYEKLCELVFVYTASDAGAKLSINSHLYNEESALLLNEIVVFGQRSAASNLRLSGANVNASFSSDEVYGTYTIKLNEPLKLKDVELAWAMTPTAVPTTNNPPVTTSSTTITTSGSTFHVVLIGLAALLYPMF